MELGAKIKQARLEAGLSQRQLCGEEITRNMLSQIENGSARPSMSTLSFLAARLGKSVSFFLDEDAVTSPNQQTMAQARGAWFRGEPREVRRLLEHYQAPDPVFDREKQLLWTLAVLVQAEEVLEKGQDRYAGELLTRLGPVEGYCGEDLENRRLLLLARALPQQRAAVCRALPALDEQLLLRAEDALDAKNPARAAALLDAAEDQESSGWNFLRGEVYLAQGQYEQAAACYHKAEDTEPEKTVPRLERCYRELEDFKQAYFYACKGR